jgi:subtilisin family serine protease
MTVTPVYAAAVAVLDTGVQCNHPDLNVIHTKQFNFERSPDPSLPGACYDGMGHGTHVSGEFAYIYIHLISINLKYTYNVYIYKNYSYISYISFLGNGTHVSGKYEVGCLASPEVNHAPPRRGG